MSPRCAARSASRSIRRPSNPPRAARRADDHPPRLRSVRARLCRGRGRSRGDHAGRRSRDAGLGLSQACARARGQHVPARIGRGRGAARPLFDDRPRSGPHLPLERRKGRDQPPRARRPGRFRPLPRRSARRAESAARGIAHRMPPGPAADVGGRIRLSRLRHGEAHGAPWRRPSPTRSACPRRF